MLGAGSADGRQPSGQRVCALKVAIGDIFASRAEWFPGKLNALDPIDGQELAKEVSQIPGIPQAS